MSENIRVYNPKGTSAVIDLAGHSLGGHSEGRVSPDRRTHALINTGALIVHPEIQRATPDPATEPVSETAPESKKRKRTTNTADNGAESGE